MKLLYGLPAALIIAATLISLKEKVSDIDRKERFLLPFYKLVKKLSRVSFIREKMRKRVLSMAENYSEIYVRKKAISAAQKQLNKVLVQSILIVLIGSVLALLAAFSESESNTARLIRNETGKGQTVYEIQAQIGGESRNVPVILEERQYTDQEINELFDYACENIEELILGENKSVNEIEEDLNLIDKLPDSAIEISWECSDYSIIQPSGELCRENLSKEGDKVRLVAVFSYMDKEKKHEVNLIVRKKSYEGIEKSFRELEEKIKIEEAASRTENEYLLPTEIEGKKINYSMPEDHRELIILILGIVVVILLPYREKSVADKQKDIRNRQMLMEYPQLVSKLSLYMGAGMNIGRAWEKIVLDYIGTLSVNQNRNYLNEQIMYTYRQLQSGVLTAKAFDEFGSRCGLQVFKKLGLLINSNMKKGSADLAEILQTEAKEAFETRKSEVIKLANEASVKLMLPMVMELIVVIGVLIVPAFLSLEV